MRRNHFPTKKADNVVQQLEPLTVLKRAKREPNRRCVTPFGWNSNHLAAVWNQLKKWGGVGTVGVDWASVPKAFSTDCHSRSSRLD